MHDEPLDQNDLSPAAMEHLDQRILRALEAVPEIHIPADFASRVAGQLPARLPVSITPTHYGYTAMLIGLLVTLGALVAVALHTTGQATFGLTESLLFAQFIALAVWFSVWRHSWR
jgi:hypothetical protein